MRRVGRLHAITDETLLSASLAASRLGFYEKPERRLPVLEFSYGFLGWGSTWS